MNRLACTLFLASSLVLGACAAAPSSEGSSLDDTATGELRAPSASFFQRSPLSGRRMEALRSEIEGNLMGHVWVLNQGTTTGMQWETKDHARLSLDTTSRAALVQAAFATHVGERTTRKLLGKLTVVSPDDASLGEALDKVGLEPSSGDAATAAERTTIAALLGALARTRSVTVMTGELHYQVDMYWENALVVVDEDNEQILFVTGGYGT